MLRPKKIFFYTALLSYLTVGVAALSYGQAKKKHKEAHPISIGFQSGRELLFNSSPLVRSYQGKVHTGINNGIVLRKPMSKHFKAETRVNYITNQFYINATKSDFGNKQSGLFTSSQVAMPVTIQYHPFCNKKISPYVGIGLQGSVSVQNNVPLNTTEHYEAGTKHASLIFTQGVTYEINTRIDISQSFHFIPQGTCNVIGIDVGIGYKFP